MTTGARNQAGRVVEFDEHVGLGTIERDDGEWFPFHCTQIADGTRTIALDTPVTFEVVVRHKGPEAYSVQPSHP